MASTECDPTADELREAAIAWLVRVQSDAATAGDWAGLTAWLEVSETRRMAFDAVERLSYDLDEEAPALIVALARPPALVVPFLRRARASRNAWPGRAIAAAVAAVTVMVGITGWKLSEGALQTFSTEPGQTRAITLADGSHIRLDAASTMSVRLGWFARNVKMGDAEATFDVAKDASRPFNIAVGDQRVRVVGTEFNIRNYDGVTKVTVRRGIVSVFQRGVADQPFVRLTKGMELVHSVGSNLSASRQVDPDEAFAWTEGRLICDEQRLSEIIPYLNRRYTTPIHLAPDVAGRRFTGVLELGDEKDVVRRLAAYLSLSMDGSDRQISIS